MAEFSHLHLHTQYSLLDGAIRVDELFPKCLELGMKSVAMTDHGNLFGAVDFYEKAKKHGVKPIFGCETYVAPDRLDKTERRSHHLILLARDNVGWKNLSYLNSMGFLEGFYYSPRVDKKLLREHSEGLIASSACLGGEIAQTLTRRGLDAAEQVAREYEEHLRAGELLPRDDGQRPARAGRGQREDHRAVEEDRHPHHRHQRLPLPQPQGLPGPRDPDVRAAEAHGQGRQAPAAHDRRLLPALALGDERAVQALAPGPGERRPGGRAVQRHLRPRQEHLPAQVPGARRATPPRASWPSWPSRGSRRASRPSPAWA